MDPLALQELQDRHTQQQPELLQCRCELKQQRLEAEKQLTQKKLQLKQQEAQDNERSSVDHGAVLEALERALKATEAAFLEMADRLLHENPELMVMGSCVLVMLMKDEDVYIMNVGDSRAVVAQQHSKSWAEASHQEPDADVSVVRPQWTS
ncbi:unnamed protein product [Sphagnum balticum]